MEIIISSSSSRPIYEQITSQIKNQIIVGELKAGEQLPSIRSLANSLRVSAITTKRAYADLEAAGFIETVQGKGSFVAGGNAELLREERLREVEGHLVRAIDAAGALDLTQAELIEMLTILLESDD
ncbi:GntR family transcriptional regulator [Collinsella provencensis]|uniref:GntR family transcriptional regulator n=1 Tax=Collinsella provencensis TaxID=1937461 RepID=UPI000C85D0FC|nr:GntR family transcriptional regulator [Collinsella provencensis]